MSYLYIVINVVGSPHVLHKELFLVAHDPDHFLRTKNLVDSLREESSIYRKVYCDGVATGVIDCGAQHGDLLAPLDDQFNSSMSSNSR